MNFFLENWHLILFGAVVLVVLAWEVLVKRHPSAERLIRALVILFATFGIAWVTQEVRGNLERSGNVEYFTSQISDRADNSFAKDILEELQEKLRKFKNRTIEAVSEADVRDQQIKALKKSVRSAVFLDHYVLVWSSGHEQELREDIAAIKRGVEVRRIWVISETLLSDIDALKKALAVMDEQRNAGIRVSFALQHELQSLHDYHRFADVDYALFDNDVLIKVGARSSPFALPTYCLIWWDRTTISDESPFSFMAGSALIKDYDQTSKTLLVSMVKRPNRSAIN